MIGIDFAFVFPQEVKAGYLYRSYELSAAAILDEFDKMGVSKDCQLIVNHYAAKFIKTRFPNYKQCVINYPLSDFIFCLTNGAKSANTWSKRHKVFEKKINRSKLDFIWYPCGLPENIGRCDIPYLCTVNDIINYHSTDNEKLKNRYKYMIKKSESIVTISNYVKNDVINSFSCEDKTIKTIPVSIKKPEKPKKEYALMKKPYILDINGFGPHKNTLTLLKAYNLICKDIPLDLCLCGGWKDEEYFSRIENYININGLQDRVKLFYGVTNDEKNWLLWNANIFVTPSLNEGFGMTPVEAAMCRVPVISTKAASLAEVTLNRANYVENATDEKELAVLIKKMFLNRPSYEILNQFAIDLENTYSAEHCANLYWNIFKRYI